MDHDFLTVFTFMVTSQTLTAKEKEDKDEEGFSFVNLGLMVTMSIKLPLRPMQNDQNQYVGSWRLTDE